MQPQFFILEMPNGRPVAFNATLVATIQDAVDQHGAKIVGCSGIICGGVPTLVRGTVTELVERINTALHSHSGNGQMPLQKGK